MKILDDNPLPDFRLQSLIPSVSIKDNVTQLDIILEAIRYISSLTTRLGEEEVSGTMTSAE